MHVAITGGTGYLGRALIPRLLAQGHPVRVLVRSGSESKVPPGAELVRGDPLRETDVVRLIEGSETLVHLVGVPHPSPAKAKLFRDVDLASIDAATAAVGRSKRDVHLVYVSVAQPAPVMRAYVAARKQGEALVTQRACRATILRPWYVLGPGHRWPVLLSPIYAALSLVPNVSQAAQRLGLVTLDEMTAALLAAVEYPAAEMRIVEVPAIRRVARQVTLPRTAAAP